ncbi:hypothetical protein H2509_02565 [Stappia sp. F7233]|uniref:Uncharacterized protein n=1 Tax=Stappia albiluteola TaxID=2758565 RepID=A0A839ABA1_9HYPH|nr:hypothetical protein [Stappia albiluteola]MBA5775989.1 hypothetical protein [Stappia albiluteola]MBA5776001.1 hypothetical protein [Stappia albiluteola]MBA5776004.1 hypothetical protein [Stappia albiluteola]
MDIKLISGNPGSCKSTTALHQIASSKKLYVVALPRIDLIKEVSERLCQMAASHGTSPLIVSIHSQTQNRMRPVTEIMDAPQTYANKDHVILLITHESMMQCEFAAFRDWHIYIDEVPSAVASGYLSIPASWPAFETAYDLMEVKGVDCWQVTLRDGAPGQRQILNDDFLRENAAFHRRVSSSHGVFVNFGDWSLLKEAATRLEWWSAWTPAELEPFASVTFVGSNFKESLLFKASESLFPGRFSLHEQTMPVTRTAWPSIRIHYFIENHIGSTEFWRGAGKPALHAVCQCLESLVDLGFWSGNQMVIDRCEGRLRGIQASPKVAGSNRYRDKTSCAFLYSSKSLPADQPLQKALGLSRNDIQRARETEDIAQFVLRGAIRDPAYHGDYDIYLYDRGQAEDLKAYLISSGISPNVSLVHNPAASGHDIARSQPGRPPREKPFTSPQEIERKKQEKRWRNAERQRKSRMLKKRNSDEPRRPRGRPRNDAASPTLGL